MLKIAKFYKRQTTLLQQIKDFEVFSIVLLRMNKQRRDCLTFIQKEYKKKMEYIQNPYNF